MPWASHGGAKSELSGAWDLLPSSAGHSLGLTVEGLNLLPASVMLAPLGALWVALSWFPRVLFSLGKVSMQS